MKIALLSVTEQGNSLSRHLAELLTEHEMHRFRFYRHPEKDAVSFRTISQQTKSIFSQSDTQTSLISFKLSSVY